MIYARFISHCNRFAVKKVPSEIYPFWSRLLGLKNFKLKNLVLIKEKVKIGLESQMWSCSKIVRIADEVSPYV